MVIEFVICGYVVGVCGFLLLNFGLFVFGRFGCRCLSVLVVILVVGKRVFKMRVFGCIEFIGIIYFYWVWFVWYYVNLFCCRNIGRLFMW